VLYGISPYSIAERRVPEVIPVLGSQPAGDVIDTAPGCHYFPPGPQLPLQPKRRAAVLVGAYDASVRNKQGV